MLKKEIAIEKTFIEIEKHLDFLRANFVQMMLDPSFRAFINTPEHENLKNHVKLQALAMTTVTKLIDAEKKLVTEPGFFK
jgi:hypothetical protein